MGMLIRNGTETYLFSVGASGLLLPPATSPSTSPSYFPLIPPGRGFNFVAFAMELERSAFDVLRVTSEETGEDRTLVAAL